jgi:hypothetical protein
MYDTITAVVMPMAAELAFCILSTSVDCGMVVLLAG